MQTIDLSTMRQRLMGLQNFKATYMSKDLSNQHHNTKLTLPLRSPLGET